MLNSKGQALIQVLVATAILGILMAAFTSMLTMHQKENQRLSDNLAKMDLERVLTSDLQDGSVCTYILTTPTAVEFDASKVKTTPPEFPITDVPVSGVAGSPSAVKVDPAHAASTISGNLFVKSITVKDFVCSPEPCLSATNLFTANLVIDFDGTKLVGAIAPLALPITIKTLPDGALQKVVSCLGVGGSPSGPGGPPVPGPGNLTAGHSPGCQMYKVPPYNKLTVEVWGGGGPGFGGAATTSGETSFFDSVFAGGGVSVLNALTSAPGGKAFGGNSLPASNPPVPDPAYNINGNVGVYVSPYGATAPGPGGGKGGGVGCAGYWGCPGFAPGGGGGLGRWIGGSSGAYTRRDYQPGDLQVDSYVPVCIGKGGTVGPSQSYTPGAGGDGDVKITIN